MLLAHAAIVLSLGVSPPGWALQKAVKSAVTQSPTSPVEIQRSQVTLTEVFASPTQIPGEPLQDGGVRYLNRKGQQWSQLKLEGSLILRNRSPQRVEAVAVTTMPLDAFHKPLDPQGVGGQGPYQLHRITEPLARGGTLQFEWEQPVGSDEVYEVAVVVTAVRFMDGSIWTAPREQLTETFFP